MLSLHHNIAEGRVLIRNVGFQSPNSLFTRITPPDAGGLAPNAEVKFHGTGTPRFRYLLQLRLLEPRNDAASQAHEPKRPPFFLLLFLRPTALFVARLPLERRRRVSGIECADIPRARAMGAHARLIHHAPS